MENKKPNEEQKAPQAQRRWRRWMNALTIFVIMACIALAARLSAQTTQGGMAGMQVGGVNPNGQVRTDIFMMVNLYSDFDRKGMNAFLFSDFQVYTNNSPWAFFAAGAAWRFSFHQKGDTVNAGFVELGFGVGFQTNQNSLMREMGYVVAVFPTKTKKKHFKEGYSNHPITIFGAFDFSNPLSYRYKAFALYQVTDAPNHVNFSLGVHAERYIAIGPTMQVHIGPTHGIQIGVIVGYNTDNNYPSGGVNFMAKF